MRGIEFYKLCEGRRWYSECLLDLTHPESDELFRFPLCVSLLADHAKWVLREIEKQSGKEISTFTIGKSYARRRKKLDFDTMDMDTWKLDDGINGKWKSYKEKRYNGLIVLACVVKNNFSDKISQMKKDDECRVGPQDYAIALKQQLIHHFLLEECDPRLGNQSFEPGNMVDDPYAGIVYLAYKFDAPEIDTPVSITQQEEANPLTKSLSNLSLSNKDQDDENKEAEDIHDDENDEDHAYEASVSSKE